MKVPLSFPSIGEEEKNAVIETLESGWLTHGKYNEKLEESLCTLLGVNNAICMNSCASALEMALAAHNISGEVVVPSFTFVASANAIVRAGAKPVFCDVDFETRNVTSENIESVLTTETEAVMVVHYAGQPCRMDEIKKLCEKNDLLLIEDSAETLGATWNGKQAGSFGIGCFSFFPTKNITTGEGGALTCNDDAIAEKVRTLIGHGISSSTLQRENSSKKWQRNAILPGNNYRMSNVLATIGYYQILKLDRLNLKRQNNARLYEEKIRNAGLPIKIPKIETGTTHVYQMYTITVDPMIRDTVVNELKTMDVGCNVHFDPPVHLQTYYKKHFPSRIELPNSELLSRSIITLPMYPDMKAEQVNYIVDCLETVISNVN